MFGSSLLVEDDDIVGLSTGSSTRKLAIVRHLIEILGGSQRGKCRVP